MELQFGKAKYLEVFSSQFLQSNFKILEAQENTVTTRIWIK